jgi:hypothetical protein
LNFTKFLANKANQTNKFVSKAKAWDEFILHKL